MLRIKYRRAREGKTDYAARATLLESNLPRLVVRKSNRYITAQLVLSREAQDFVLVGVTSKALLGYGWPSHAAGTLKSIPAAYLTGFLLGEKIKGLKPKIEKAILDIGLQRSTCGGRIYGVVAGIKEAGIEIPCKNKMLPKENRLFGEHMKAKFPIEEIKKAIKEKCKPKSS